MMIRSKKAMGTTVIHSFLTFISMAAVIFCSGTNVQARQPRVLPYNRPKKLQETTPISTRKMDITTPLTTVPTTPTYQVLNPTDDSTSESPMVMNPANPRGTTPLITNSPASSVSSWCVASQSASQAALQVALDYACGHGRADCSAIQPEGACYNPETVRDHASYAFNSYYQKNPIPTSCNFGGTAVTTSTDPSYAACQYPSTSTSSSILNISNSSGSRVFGGDRPTSMASRPSCVHYLHYLLLFIMIVSSFK